MTYLELVQHYFPKASNEEADFILWEYTGFPEFFHLTKEYPTNISRLRKQLRTLKYRLQKPEDSHE